MQNIVNLSKHLSQPKSKKPNYYFSDFHASKVVQIIVILDMIIYTKNINDFWHLFS